MGVISSDDFCGICINNVMIEYLFVVYEFLGSKKLEIIEYEIVLRVLIIMFFRSF